MSKQRIIVLGRSFAGMTAAIELKPEAHWPKLAFEKYFLRTHKAGAV